MSPNDATLIMVEPVIDHSLSLLSGRSTPADAAHGIMAAIRRVRGSLEELGGDALVTILDAAIRDRLIIRNLRRRRVGQTSDSSHLPAAGGTAGIAETVMVTAAETCMLYAARDPDVGGMLVVVLVLLDRLIETLGHAPDYADLMAWLRLNDDLLSRGPLDDRDVVAAVVH